MGMTDYQKATLYNKKPARATSTLTMANQLDVLVTT